MIPVYTSKELNLILILKYKISSSLFLPMKRCDPEEICLIFKKRAEHSLKVIES